MEPECVWTGHATRSVKAAHRNLHRYYKIPVAKFSLSTVHTPQTTVGASTPHRSSIETTEEIAREIERHEFDTVLLACGAYGPPLTRIINERFNNSRNILYLGSAVYRLFGISTREINASQQKFAWLPIRPHGAIRALEQMEAGRGFLRIDNGKYWA